MKKYYIDPLSGEKVNEISDARSKLISECGVGVYPAIMLENDDDLIMECVVDPEVYTIYINAEVPFSGSPSMITSVVDEVMSKLPIKLDYTTKTEDILINRKDSLFLSIKILDYSKLPLLRGDLLAEKIYANMEEILKE